VSARVSFIIAARQARHVRACVERLEQIDLDADRYEVLLTMGDAPAAQRNAAAAAAVGDVLYFLDDDSLIDPLAPALALDVLEDEALGAVGGPAEPLPSGSAFSIALAAAMTSWFGMGPACRRYRPEGTRRMGGELDAIGCNLAVRADAFEQAGGFDERLFPNEENELVARMNERHTPLVIEPAMRVQRPLDDDALVSARRFFRYGRGRIAHFVARPASFQLLFLLPLLWVALLGAWVVAGLAWWWGMPWGVAVLTALSVPVALYASLAAAAALHRGRQAGNLTTAALVLLLYPLLHTAYGAGMAAGLWAPGFVRSAGAPLVLCLKPLQANDRKLARGALEQVVTRAHVERR
jgi:succinoglycan biosynthesis protein ExoA